MLSIQRQGAEFALVELANHFGRLLPVKLPKLWDAIVGPLQDIKKGDPFGKKDVRFSLTTSLGFSEAWLPLAAILRSLRYGFYKPGCFLRSPRLTTSCILYPVTAIKKKVASIIHHCLFPFFTPLVV